MLSPLTECHLSAGFGPFIATIVREYFYSAYHMLQDEHFALKGSRAVKLSSPEPFAWCKRVFGWCMAAISAAGDSTRILYMDQLRV